MAIKIASVPEKDLRFFKVILGSIAEGVFTVDSERCITSFNAAAEKITGVSESEAVGKKCFEVFHSDVCETACQLNRTMITGQESMDIPVNIKNSAGKSVPISVSTSVLRDEKGEILGAVETFRDLSAIENLRKKLQDNYTFEDIVTKNHTLQSIINVLPDMAASNLPVLIQGSTGSGKSLFSRAVYNLSNRKDKPFVEINCGTLPKQLIESELFGYVKEAFADAREDKPGKISHAEGGTLYLEQVDEIPIILQDRLLRLLQQKEYSPLGGDKILKSNVRVVASTKSDLRSLVEAGSFREDLYFQISMIKIDLPSLNDRREDIPILVDHFIQFLNAKSGKRIKGVTSRVMDLLVRHEYRSNVRELEDSIEYSFSVCHEEFIDIKHLPQEYLDASSIVLDDSEKANESIPQSPRKKISADEIRYALKIHNGNKARAAEELEIDRTTLWRKIKSYKIES
jgi:PAS domain S-box-containing protein